MGQVTVLIVRHRSTPDAHDGDRGTPACTHEGWWEQDDGPECRCPRVALADAETPAGGAAFSTWLVGERTQWWAGAFMHDLAGRLAGPTQLTTDGHGMYPPAVWEAFGIDVDYAQLIKHYDSDTEGEKRYSPAVCTGTEMKRIIGDPKREAVSTSQVERQNLTMRMSMRRFTRLTNAFSKKLENLECAVALHFVHYNFCRKHQTLKGQTPAMAAGLTDHVWSVGELVSLLDRENVSAATS